MKFLNLIKTFSNDESGAVTVDWVVLTAAIVGLGIAVIMSVSGGVNNLASNISDALGEVEIGSGVERDTTTPDPL
ncbi:MAG TPA: pilus assembly protein [Paracoccus sp.]|nr:pilus assembly protein [Paracoccus sp. (in: a-proteobacteria)]